MTDPIPNGTHVRFLADGTYEPCDEAVSEALLFNGPPAGEAMSDERLAAIRETVERARDESDDLDEIAREMAPALLAEVELQRAKVQRRDQRIVELKAQADEADRWRAALQRIADNEGGEYMGDCECPSFAKEALSPSPQPVAP